jgi:hypothetical protein
MRTRAPAGSQVGTFGTRACGTWQLAPFTGSIPRPLSGISMALSKVPAASVAVKLAKVFRLSTMTKPRRCRRILRGHRP